MGIFDTFKKLTNPYDDDDLDYDEDMDAYDTEPAPAPAQETRRAQPAASHAPSYERPAAAAPAAAPHQPQHQQAARSRDKVVNIANAASQRVILVHPERFDAAAEIADNLRDKCTIVMNLEQTNKDIARRLIDFLSGVAYAQEGKIKKVALNTYIITPYNVDLMGELMDELENNGMYM